MYSKPFTDIPWPGWEYANAEQLKNKKCAYLTRSMYDDSVLGVIVNQEAMQKKKRRNKKFREKVKNSFSLIVNTNFDSAS